MTAAGMSMRVSYACEGGNKRWGELRYDGISSCIKSDLPLLRVSPVALRVLLPGDFPSGAIDLARPFVPRTLQRALRFSIGERREVEVVCSIFNKPIGDV